MDMEKYNGKLTLLEVHVKLRIRKGLFILFIVIVRTFQLTYRLNLKVTIFFFFFFASQISVP